MKMNKHDLNWCVRRLPFKLRELLKKEEIVVAGGYIRACITREPVNDVDLFIPDKEYAKELALGLADDNEKRTVVTGNAITVKGLKIPVQFITRWLYDDPEGVLGSFDFTICQAAFWFDHYCQRWKGAVSDDFYPDLAAKRLIYTEPVREEAAGGSMLRILKYYQRGYRITIPSLSGVISRLAEGVDFSGQMTSRGGKLNGPQFKKVVTGLLREVDPNVDPDHIIHEEGEDEE